MRLRRLELVVIGVTLAFACFIGGYFVGRSWSTVNIVAAPQADNEVQISVSSPAHSGDVTPGGAETPASEAADNNNETIETATPGGGAAPQETDSATAPRDSDGRININTASRAELMDLPGIGSVLSERIVDYRNLNGPFNRIEDIRNVSGIGEKRFEAIQDKITVG